MAGEKTLRRLKAIENLLGAFRAFAVANGCTVYTPGQQIRLPSGHEVYPDAVLHRGSLAAAGGLAGVPDLVVQILHNSKPDGERVLKRALYEKSGIKEYWILDAVNSTVEVLSLRDGRYDAWGAFGAASTVTSPAFPGLAVPLAALFE